MDEIETGALEAARKLVAAAEQYHAAKTESERWAASKAISDLVADDWLMVDIARALLLLSQPDKNGTVRAICSALEQSPGCLYPGCDCEKLPRVIIAALSSQPGRGRGDNSAGAGAASFDTLDTPPTALEIAQTALRDIGQRVEDLRSLVIHFNPDTDSALAFFTTRCLTALAASNPAAEHVQAERRREDKI